jgi:predicted nucleic acid-binding protein
MHTVGGGNLINSLLTFDGCQRDFGFEVGRVVVSLPRHSSSCIVLLGQRLYHLNYWSDFRGVLYQFTTNVLLIESHALILSVLGRTWAAQFLTDMHESHTVILRVRAADEARAQQILFQYTDKDFSFADATSFAVMERLAIRLAFTFDRDFAQYGFTVLTAT